jgi:hypothetical protein
MDQPPAAPERTSRTERADDAERRRSLWLRIGAGVAVLALLVVAGIFLLGGGGPGGGPGAGPGPTGFSFTLKRAKAAPVSDLKVADLQDVADETAETVKATMDHFYFEAYVNQDGWGSYEEAFAFLQDPAASSAGDDTAVLTLGATAAEEYEAVVDEPAGTLNVVVLTNEKDVAISAIATVVFRMDAQLAAGGTTRITSTGSYFLRPGDEAWEIFAYSVDRNEQEAGAQPSPTAEDQ